MKRLFYFTGYRLKVFHWKGRTLAGEIAFEPSASGLDAFRTYLQQSVNLPAKLLVDVIEEDFRIETVPHVGSKDRKAVITRLIDRFYRSSQQYCYSEVIGRETSGRKDDRVLIGAMTNPALIQPWLSIIEECEVPLAGIWTLPLVSRNLLPKINAGKGVTLLVSQQVNSNVRQSLFRDGKLLSSRQSIINQDMSDSVNIGAYTGPEVERTLKFLRNQGLLGMDEVVNLHVIGNDQQMASLQQAFVSDERQQVSVHSTSAIIKKLRLKNVGTAFSDGVFSWLCVEQQFRYSHYGDYSLFTRYFNALASSALYVASLLVLVAGFLLTESNISSALGHKEATVLLKKEEQEYRTIYNKRFKDYEAVFDNAGLMNSAVELAERIRHNGRTSPLDFMLQLSHILSRPGLPEIEVDKIEWWAVNSDEENRPVNVDSKSRAANFTAATEVFHHAVLSGRIRVSEYDYRESINQINMIIHALEAHDEVIDVDIISLPVDMRSNSKFSTESGVELNDKKGRDLRGMFKLKLTMRASEHV